MIKKTIPAFLKGKTINQLFEYCHSGKSFVYQCKEKKAVSINNQVVSFDYILQTGDVIEIDLSFVPKQEHFSSQPIIILYEDEDMLIVNKPAFLLVHDDGNTQDNLLSRVNYYLRDQSNQAQVVHRLDYEVSGVVLFSKHPLAHTYFNHLFFVHEIEKKYQCLVEKVPSCMQIKASIGKDRHQNKQRISKTGKQAITNILQIQQENKHVRVDLEIVTGRKHQIRIHLAFIGSPIIGDTLYGGKEASRLMLHCMKMKFQPFFKIEFLEVQAKCPF